MSPVGPTLAARWLPGLVCLKGGELDAEIAAAGRPALRIALSDYFREEFFETKELVYVPFS